MLTQHQKNVNNIKTQTTWTHSTMTFNCERHTILYGLEMCKGADLLVALHAVKWTGIPVVMLSHNGHH